MAWGSGRRLIRDVGAACDIAFQPIVHLLDRSIKGYEALLRPSGADDTAATRLFERASRLGVTAAVESAAFSLAADRFDDVKRAPGELLFCNFSGLSFSAEQRLQPTGHALCIEVSEKETLDVRRFAAWLERWPVRPLVALDDFGTGWNGLAMVRSLRPDFIKVDRLYVSGIDRDPGAARFLCEIVRFAHAIGCRVIGEGIETESEYALCLDARCDFGQGFLLGPPRVAPRAGHARR